MIPSYLDEDVYIECGLSYVSGAAPYLCNFEHPPFAKYLIGFFSLFGLARYFYMFLFMGSVFLVYCLLDRFGYGVVGVLVSFLLVFDTIYFNSFRFLLLDPVAVFFSVFGLYLFFVDRLSFSAVSMGLAVASKFSSIPILFTTLCFVYRSRGFKTVLRYLVIVFIVYISTYIADFSLSLDAVIRHHIDMYRYMSWRHGFSLPVALNGFLKLVTRIEFWRYVGDIHVYLGNISNTYYIVNKTLVSIDKGYFIIGVGQGSILWYILFPALLVSTYIILTSSRERELAIIAIVSWASLINIVAGPLDWYYSNILPFLYSNLCIALQRFFRERFRYIAIALVLAQLSMFIATVIGFIPFKIVFVR